jgi:thiamine pyrophosphokinase
MEVTCEKLHVDLCDSVNVSLNFLILLNSPSLDFSQIKQCWDYCGTIICADGGANRLYDMCNNCEKKNYTPNCIIGDLDSLRSDVAVQYKYV